MLTYGCEKGQAGEPSWVGEMISVGKVFLTEQGDDMLQVTQMGQHGCMTETADLKEVEQVVVMPLHLVHQ